MVYGLRESHVCPDILVSEQDNHVFIIPAVYCVDVDTVPDTCTTSAVHCHTCVIYVPCTSGGQWTVCSHASLVNTSNHVLVI